MTNHDYQAAAEDIHDAAPDDVETTVDEIADLLERFVSKYDLPWNEAKRSARDSVFNESDEDASPTENAADEDLHVGDLDKEHEDEWFNLEVEVLDLWDDTHEKIAQKGLIGDNTGKTVFTIFQSAADENEDILLEEGESYRLESVVGDYYQGDAQVKVNQASDVEKIDAEFEPPEHEVDLRTALVDVQDGSGLIKRCPEDDCTRPLNSSRCTEHGDVDGEFDLRIKAVLDDGDNTHQVIFNQELTEQVANMTLDEAVEMAEDAMDTSVVANEIEKRVIGRYFTILGRRAEDYVIPDEVGEEPEDTPEARAEALLADNTAAAQGGDA
ncbi:replication factor A [Salinibaculum rarum]|uniref:replication factor A n=1 Tax=Salinibaculum rarum TaxID=3058903 RepID=UPI00265E5B66|nr:replication factor A [Salinibaculum sp. KK48]